MAMTAADMLKMRDSFVPLDDYKQDKKDIGERIETVEKRVKCTEDKQTESDKVIVRVDTQLKILLWLNSIIVIAVVGYIVKMIFA